MSKEKQIEERIELSDIIDYALRDWDDYIYECQEEGNRPIDTFEEWIADAVLKNGYRKQSEGEWITKHRHRGGFRTVTVTDSFGNTHTGMLDDRWECDDLYCSVCGKISHDAFLNYCANCGAKMKGGAE